MFWCLCLLWLPFACLVNSVALDNFVFGFLDFLCCYITVCLRCLIVASCLCWTMVLCVFVILGYFGVGISVVLGCVVC